VIERDEESLGRLLRRLAQREPGRNSQTGCPEDETLAAYLDGGLSESARDEIESHLAECRSCLDHFLAAEKGASDGFEATVPPRVLARAMALVPQRKPKDDIFHLVVELARDSLALISTSGRLVVPTLAVQIRGKENMTASDVLLCIESELGQFQVSVEVERLEDNLCQVAVKVTPIMGSGADGLRFSLMSGQREQASYLARQGAATFDRVPPGEYRLAVTESGKSLGAIELTIKEDSRER